VPTRTCALSHTITREPNLTRATSRAPDRGIFLTSLLGVAYLRSCSERRIPNALLKVVSHSPKGRASISFMHANLTACMCVRSLSFSVRVRASEMLPRDIPRPVLTSMILDDVVAACRQFLAPIDCYFVFPIKAGRPRHNEMLSSRAIYLLSLSFFLSSFPHPFVTEYTTLRGTGKYSIETARSQDL